MRTKDTDTKGLVQVSGRGTSVNFKVDDDAPMEAACGALLEHLKRNRKLYSGGEVVVDIGRRLLRQDQQAEIRRVVESQSGLTVKRFWCEPEILERERQRITELIEDVSPDRRPAGQEKDTDKTEVADDGGQSGDEVLVGGIIPGGERYGAPGLIVRGTCRAGEVINGAGNLVILGNVNPGAQVRADGDIVVFGELRGQAHAGASGDATATIVAMSIARPNLRIAGYAGQDDGGPATAPPRHSGGKEAMIARVRNGAIHVAPYRNNHAIDHGGNPHER